MSNTIEEKLNLRNKLARALAKEEGITELEALTRIKREFMDRDETAETIKGMGMPRMDFGDNSQKVAPEDAYAVYSEQAKVEMKKLEIQQKQIDTEQKRLDTEAKKQEYLDKKLESEERMQKEKLDREERMQTEKLDREDKIQTEKLDREDKIRREEIQIQKAQREDDSKLERDRAHVEKLIMLSNLSGKKGAPDELMEYLKSQSESTKEFYAIQGESQKDMYKTLLATKDAERDKEYEWKKELAKIEAERELEMAKLRQDDPKVASSTEILIDTLREQFENLGTRLTTNPDNDFVAQIDRHNKFQESLVRAAMPILKAQGMSEEQIEKVKQQVGMEEERQESSLSKIWDAGKVIWNKVIVPAADKVSKENEATALDNRVSPEIEKRIREETEAKAIQIAKENAVLLQQLEEEKKRIGNLQEERMKLEATANQLGIPYDNTITNQELFYWIEHQEAVLEQQKAAATERHAALEREERARRARIPQEAVAVPEIVPEVHEAETPVYQVLQESQEPEQNIEDPDIIPIEPGQETINIQEELAKPRETSQETADFMKEVAASEDMLEEEPLEEKSKPQKKIRGKGKTVSKRIFKVSDGTQVIEVESTNHKGAAMGVANQLGGTESSPIRITVTDESGEERQYDTFSAERQSTKGKKWMAPRVKVV